MRTCTIDAIWASTRFALILASRDAAIEALSGSGAGDQLALSRLKKRKLQLKDEIAEINNSLLPDIIA